MAIIISKFAFKASGLEQREIKLEKSYLLPYKNTHWGNEERKTASKDL